MADHTDNNMRAAVRALSDVVAPAVDPDNPLAVEQLRLVIEWLEFHRTRLPFVRGRERFELVHHIDMAEALLAICDGETADLSRAVELSRSTRDDAAATTDDIREATRRLEDAVSAAVREHTTKDPEVRRGVETLVIARTKRWLDLQRAWFAPVSAEPNPAALPTLTEALNPEDLRR